MKTLKRFGLYAYANDKLYKTEISQNISEAYKIKSEGLPKLLIVNY